MWYPERERKLDKGLEERNLRIYKKRRTRGTNKRY